MNYPTELPFLEIKNVLVTIRSGTITEQRAEFAQSLWVIQGYAQSKILGSGKSPISSQAAEDEDPVALLEKLVNINTISTQSLQDTIKDCLSAIDWATVLQWAVKLLVAHLTK